MLIKLISINHEVNRNRFYEINDLQLSLWDDNYILELHWGRIGTNGRKKSLYFDSDNEMIKEINRRLQKRSRHGYLISESQ
ncbi:MAG: WGR domain-containing protein [Spirochaetota bacterium]|nr:WGR domain-containing protein [Spirochaetota bacterium]